MAKLGIALVLVFLTTTTPLGAAPRGRTPPASTLGLVLTKLNNRLIVVDARASQSGLAAWDQIVAVNGRRVTTETAFMHRLVKSGAATVMVNRNGNRFTVNLAAGAGRPAAPPSFPRVPRTSGWMNPAQMVLTPQGVMHIERARLLGLPGVPIEGTPPYPPIPK